MAALKPAAPPDPGNGFDISPPHLYYTSYLLRNQQYDFSDSPGRLLDELDNYAHAGGRGSGPEAFAATYAEIAKRFTEVWGRAAVGVGGAAVGLTVTANNYVRAEYLSDPKMAPALQLKPEPDVFKGGSSYRPAAELDWTGLDWTGLGHGSQNTFVDRIISDVVAVIGVIGEDVLLPILRNVLRHGKVADITPGGDDLALPEIATAWTAAAKDAKAAGDDFDAAIAYITNPTSGHSEWQDAMKQFCSSIWGTTAWGKDREGQRWNHSDGQKPVLGVLEDTANTVADACTQFGAAVAKVRSELTAAYGEAVVKTFAFRDLPATLASLREGASGLAMDLINNLDTARLNRDVDAYNATVSALAGTLSKLAGPLDEAYLSVPTFAAEEGRAEGVGARALNEFKREHNYTVPQGDKNNHYFAIDLANQESLDGSHPIDKHVGMTDQQLAQRLRDQQILRGGNVTPSAASTFVDLNSAQSLTQRVLDDDDNAIAIDRWLRRQEAAAVPNPRSSLTVALPFGAEVTGRTVTRVGHTAAGLQAPAQDTHSVAVTLRYARGIDPPFIVVTSVPTTP